MILMHELVATTFFLFLFDLGQESASYSHRKLIFSRQYNYFGGFLSFFFLILFISIVNLSLTHDGKSHSGCGDIATALPSLRGVSYLGIRSHHCVIYN